MTKSKLPAGSRLVLSGIWVSGVINGPAMLVSGAGVAAGLLVWVSESWGVGAVVIALVTRTSVSDVVAAAGFVAATCGLIRSSDFDGFGINENRNGGGSTLES